MPKSASILSFGSLNIDHVYQLPQIVRPGETIATTNYTIHPGGKGLNQSLALARAGLAVSHAGRVGPEGLWLCDVLRESGADSSYVRCCEQEHSGHAVIQVAQNGLQSGQNSIVLYSGANRSWTDAEIEELFAEDWRAVVCQNEMNGLETLLRCANEKNIPVILNAAPYDAAIAELELSSLHTLLVNETEAMGLAGTEQIETAFSVLKHRYPELRFVMTLGADGVQASYLGQDHSLPVFPANLVDSTAAGDTFVGYYAASILCYQPDDFAAALLLGSCAAALAVSRLGAAPSIPSLAELEPMLK